MTEQPNPDFTLEGCIDTFIDNVYNKWVKNKCPQKSNIEIEFRFSTLVAGGNVDTMHVDGGSVPHVAVPTVSFQHWKRITSRLTNLVFEQQQDVLLHFPDDPSLKQVRARTHYADVIAPLPAIGEVNTAGTVPSSPAPTVPHFGRTRYEAKKQFHRHVSETSGFVIKMCASYETDMKPPQSDVLPDVTFSRIKHMGTLKHISNIIVPELLPQLSLLTFPPIHLRYDIGIVWEAPTVNLATRKQHAWLEAYRQHRASSINPTPTATAMENTNASLGVTMLEKDTMFVVELEWEHVLDVFMLWVNYDRQCGVQVRQLMQKCIAMNLAAKIYQIEQFMQVPLHQ